MHFSNSVHDATLHSVVFMEGKNSTSRRYRNSDVLKNECETKVLKLNRPHLTNQSGGIVDVTL